MKIRTIIADDERPAREYLKAVLRQFDEIELVGEAESGPQALKVIEDRSADLALLDLQMPEMSGIDVARSLTKDKMPLIAFVTAYDDFAVQAFELNAVDYLLKPVEKKRLRITLDRVAERLEDADWRERWNEELSGAVRTYDTLSQGEFLERIPIKEKGSIIFVPVEVVVAITADGELLHISTARGQDHTINFRLRDLEQRLDPRKFIRLSRGAVVNVEMVARVSPMPGGTFLVELKNGQRLTSSRQQSKVMRTKLLKL